MHLKKGNRRSTSAASAWGPVVTFPQKNFKGGARGPPRNQAAILLLHPQAFKKKRTTSFMFPFFKLSEFIVVTSFPCLCEERRGTCFCLQCFFVIIIFQYAALRKLCRILHEVSLQIVRFGPSPTPGSPSPQHRLWQGSIISATCILFISVPTPSFGLFFSPQLSEPLCDPNSPLHSLLCLLLDFHFSFQAHCLYVYLLCILLKGEQEKKQVDLGLHN